MPSIFCSNIFYRDNGLFSIFYFEEELSAFCFYFLLALGLFYEVFYFVVVANDLEDGEDLFEETALDTM